MPMRIQISNEIYTHIIDLKAKPDELPPVDDSVDAVLHLLTYFYPAQEVIDKAHDWMP